MPSILNIRLSITTGVADSDPNTSFLETTTQHPRTTRMAPKFEHDALVTDEALRKAAAMEVLDSDGKAVRFWSLFEDRTTVVVFIRMCIFLQVRGCACSVHWMYRSFLLWSAQILHCSI